MTFNNADEALNTEKKFVVLKRLTLMKNDSIESFIGTVQRYLRGVKGSINR